MRRLLALALLATVAYFAPVTPAAHAQGCGPSNPNCIVPMLPANDNTNAAASTAWVRANGGGGGTPGGVSGDIQFNNASAFGGITLGANTALGALVASTPVALALPSCSGAANALIWTTGTGFGCNTISGGGGGVSSFSAGTLVPLFTTSVATPTTTPALSFTLTAAAANQYFGTLSGTTPQYNTIAGCSAAGSALTYTTNTGFTCVTNSTLTIASGTAALGTSAIASAACAAAVTVSATGVATTDTLTASFNGDPTAVTGYVPLTTGMLTIIPYPTANNVNFKVCNNTTASITPGAITLNWRVVR